MTIGEKIKNLRENRKLKLDEVSEKAKIEEKRLNKIEKDMLIPSKLEITALAKVFDVPFEEIITDETIKESTKINVSKSINNFIFAVLNAVIFLFFIIIAFIPSLAITYLDGSVEVFSFNSILMETGNPLVVISFVFDCIGLLIALALVAIRYIPKLKLSQNIVMAINFFLVAILILTIVTIFTVISVYSGMLVEAM